MVRVSSDIGPKAEKWLKEIEVKAEQAVHRAMTRTGLLAESRVKGILEKEAYDTGRLLRSVNFTVTKKDHEMLLTVGSNLEYAFFVEHGRKPGKWPNLDALTKWVGRKLRQQGVNTRVNVSFDELKRLARANGKATEQQKAYRRHLSMLYLVGRKIATKGVRQKLIFKRIEEAMLAFFRKELQIELQSVS